MITVSNEFLQTMDLRTDFKEQAEVTFADGKKLQLSESDFTVANNSVTDGAGSSSFPLGAAIERQIQIELWNGNDRFNDYDFLGAKIRLYLTFQLSKTTEKIEYGTFTVTQPETYGETVIVYAADEMYLADKAFATNLTYPTSISALLQEICETCGIELASQNFTNSGFLIKRAPDSNNQTYRKMIGYIAMLAGGNAKINHLGKLEIKTYDLSALAGDILEDSDGSTILDSDGDPILLRGAQAHVLKNWKSLKTGLSDITITGVRITKKDGSESKVYQYGKDGYVLNLTNPLADGQEQETVDMIGPIITGYPFRDFSGDYIAYPLAEFMDPVLILDRKGGEYKSFLTDVNFAFFGITTLKNASKSAVRNASTYAGSDTTTDVEARKLINEERTARETAIKNLQQTLEKSSGMYTTAVAQPDGSTVYYSHDKPTLEESQYVWKFTIEAIGISLDGGKTYPYGLDVSGTAILERIYAIGLDADWINSGSITARDKDGKTVFEVNVEAGTVFIDASCITVGSQSLIERLDGVQTEIDRSYTNATQTASEIITEAVKEYVKTGDLEEFKQQISTQFVQTADSVDLIFKQVTEQISSLQDDTNTEFTEIKKYIRFADGNIILGQQDNPLVLTLKNNRISFTSSGVEVAYFSDNKMYISSLTVTTSAEIVSLSITQDTDNIYIDW